MAPSFTKTCTVVKTSAPAAPNAHLGAHASGHSVKVKRDHSTEPERAIPRSEADYSRWRPSFHVLPPYGWCNDPCGPGYDPSTGLYHLSFQWNPKSAEWGDITWGHAVSRDLVHWNLPATPNRTRNGHGVEGWDRMNPILAPHEAYDAKGVFTGCLWPEGVQGARGVLTAVYTSVSHLPIHYALPYHRGSESLSLATSHDGGRTWRRWPHNPILPGAPLDLSVQAWRDPFVTPWPALSRLLGRDEAEKWGIISGSIEKEGPNIFLYSIADGDLSKWSYITPLIYLPQSRARPNLWTGDFGKNWEVCNILPRLISPGRPERVFLTMSTEGVTRWGLKEGTVLRPGEGGRTPRWNLWMAGSLRLDADGKPRVEHAYGGVLDHGCYYAANSFWDPVKAITVVWGWILEDDLPPSLRQAQAWAGVISLPRELSLLRIPGVVGTLRTPVQDIGCFAAEDDGRGKWIVETLGIKPVKELTLLRKGTREVRIGDVRLDLVQGREVKNMGVMGKCWELEATVGIGDGRCMTRVGMYMRHSRDMRQYTELTFEPIQELIRVSHAVLPSSPVRKITTDTGAHTLFSFSDGTREKLRLHVFCDNSVLEVFANERFAMSCRMYPWEGKQGEEAGEISLFAEGEGEVLWEDVTVWTGLKGGGS